jgi:hypothetical protein
MPQPGDTVTVEQGPTSVTSHPLRKVLLTGIDVASDKVTGEIHPRAKRAFVSVWPEGKLTPTGWEYRHILEADAMTFFDGTFSIDLTAAGGLRRWDMVFAGYEDGIFRVGRGAAVPGIGLGKDDSLVTLVGFPDTRYTLQLANSHGDIKGRAPMRPHLFGGWWWGGWWGNNVISFTDAEGRPVPIREGDLIRVIGKEGFTYRVPKFDAEIGATSATITTLPGRAFYSWVNSHSPTDPNNWWGWGGYGQTDGTGVGTIDFSPPWPFQIGARLGAEMQDRGNWVTIFRTLTTPPSAE